MTRSTRLREKRGALPDGVKVIDADYQVVGGFGSRLKRALITTLWFAIAGFLLPPAWVLAQRIHEALQN